MAVRANHGMRGQAWPIARKRMTEINRKAQSRRQMTAWM
jgi:hypothetical protein